MSDHDDDDITNGLPTYTSLEIEAVAYLRRTGMGVVARPDEDPNVITYIDEKGEVHRLTFPNGDATGRVLDEIPSGEIGRWIGHLAAWSAYGRHLEGVNSSIRVEAAARTKQARSLALVAAEGNTTERREAADADPLVLRLREIEEMAHKRAKLLEGRLAGIDRQFQAVSREVTRREAEIRQAGPNRHST